MRLAAKSAKAQWVLTQLTQLQHYFAQQLSNVARQAQQPTQFVPVEWLRDEGKHGGGERLQASEGGLFNRASVNVSQIQYEQNPDKAFASATALSTIIHPVHPLSPSIHIHISWTELKSGKKYWRIMADLNPAIEDKADTNKFSQVLEQASGVYFAVGSEQGDEYFNIPALKRHRGVSHFYLEGFEEQPDTPENYAIDFGKQVIDCYIEILTGKSIEQPTITAEQQRQQLDYHTLYFYQVLTLDKGTTAGLLIHNQNDVGTLGSLPSHINLSLLKRWAAASDAKLNDLLLRLIAVFPEADVGEVTGERKAEIAIALREHYKAFA